MKNHPVSGLHDPTCKQCAEKDAEIKRLQLAVVDLATSCQNALDLSKIKTGKTGLYNAYLDKHAETIKQARKAVK